MSNIKESQNMRLKNVLTSFGIYVALFVGTGFLSGSIVHYPINPVRYAVIGLIGAVIFTIASTINEAMYNNKNFKDEGVVKIIFFSLLLSVGIGMISGGVQHFDEYPIYASYLIPFGILLSLVAYIFKSNIKLLSNQIIKLSVLTFVLLAPLGIGLNAYAKTLNIDGHGHEEEMNNQQTSMSHFAVIASDQDFLINMIPHHEEAVSSSQYVLLRTTDPELKQFLEDVIDTQSQEVSKMKQWYTEWFSEDYGINSNYEPMMSDLAKYSDDELEKQYVKDMIAHHNGAIQMAKDALDITTRLEIKNLATSILNSQEKEVDILNNWLQTKYKNTGSDVDAHMEDSGH